MSELEDFQNRFYHFNIQGYFLLLTLCSDYTICSNYTICGGYVTGGNN